MKKRRTWQSKLTKAELKHLKDVWEKGARITLDGLKSMFEHQARMRAGKDGFEPCWECKKIARKLGFVEGL